MMFDPLILDPTEQGSWKAFQVAPRALEGRGGVFERWQRSFELGAPGEGPGSEDAIERGAALRARVAPLDPLLACGRSVLERVGRVADEHDYALLLADPDGVVVQTMAGGGFRREAKRLRLIEGAHWDESIRGTNAIGTAIAEQRPVFVRGSAHYARSYHDLVCYAAPVRGPDGEVAAVLDATSVFAGDDRSMGFGVVAAAHALEEVLRARSYQRAGPQVMRTIARTLDYVQTPAVLVEPPGRVARCNAAAMQLIGEQAATVDLQRLFGVGFARLIQLAGDDALRVRLGGRGPTVRLRVEPIDSDGGWIAALVLLETIGSGCGARLPIGEAGRGTSQSSPAPFAALFREDAAMRTALDFARRIAPSQLPVMILAETGAGKELVAQGIHDASGRGDEPFVAVNCGSIQASLLESELFGYGPGAFTGAERQGRDGYLAAAGGGTLFLDEVAEMSLAMQAALLRVLEAKSFRRVGETELRLATCRVVCATCRDLPAMVQAGTFRRDLYYRLKGATVSLPALRERTDVVALARHLLSAVAAAYGMQRTPEFSDAVAARFAADSWPGNVRELKTTLEVAVVLAAGAESIELEHLPEDRRAPVSEAAAGPLAGAELAGAEAAAVQRALATSGGNVSRAAQSLGVARSTLYRMIKRHGL